MSRVEFAKIMAYLGIGCGKPLATESQTVYFDLLGDLPVDALQFAARRVLLEHRWATFPSVAELREAAVESIRGEVKGLSPAEAWEIAWRVAGRIDPEQEGSAARALDGVAPLVVETMKAFGIPALCYGEEPVGVVRGQFMKMFDQLAAREKRAALLPPAMRGRLADVKRERELPPALRLAIAGVSKPVTGDNA